MTIPTLLGSWTTAGTSTGTSHSITLPSGINAGDVIWVFFQLVDNGAPGFLSISTDPGWALADGLDENLVIHVGHVILRVYYKIADGTESGATWTVTTNNNCFAAMAATRSSGGSLSAQVDGGIVVLLSGTNPASHDWGDGDVGNGTYSRDTLVFAVQWYTDYPTYDGALTPPSGYTMQVEVTSSGATSGPFGGDARAAGGKARMLIATQGFSDTATEDPGAFSGFNVSASDTFASSEFTAGVDYAGGGPPPSGPSGVGWWG